MRTLETVSFIDCENRGGVKIDTRKRTIKYRYAQDEEKMQDAKILRLCNEFGFVRQAEI